MKHINEKQKLSIEVLEEYARIPEEHYEKLGMPKSAINQTPFVFLMENEDFTDFFNITQDIVYPSNEEAMTKGIELNLEILKASGAKIASQEEIKFADGSKAIKVVCEMNEGKFETLFKSIDGLLLCMGFAFEDDLKAREENFIEMFASLKRI